MICDNCGLTECIIGSDVPDEMAKSLTVMALIGAVLFDQKPDTAAEIEILGNLWEKT